MKYRSKRDGSIVELSDRAAAILVPNGSYEELKEGEGEDEEKKTPKKRKPKK